jgi:hypothetical protein
MPSFFVAVREAIASMLVDPSLKTGDAVTDFHTFILVCIVVISMINFAMVGSFFVAWLFRKAAKIQIAREPTQEARWDTGGVPLIPMGDEDNRRMWAKEEEEEGETSEEIIGAEEEEEEGGEEEAKKEVGGIRNRGTYSGTRTYESVFDWDGREKLDDKRYFTMICCVENKTREMFKPPPHVNFEWGTEVFDIYGLVYSVVSLHHINSFESVAWSEISQYQRTHVTRSLWESIEEEDRGKACVVALYDSHRNTIHGMSKQKELDGECPRVAWQHSRDGIFTPVIVYYDDEEDDSSSKIIH